MHIWIGALALTFLSAVLLPTASGGTSESVTDRHQMINTVQTLVDAWREADVAKAKSVLHEDYRAESWQQSETGRFLFTENRDHLLAQMAKLRPKSWDVHLLRTTVKIDSNGVAVLWARYEFYFDGKPDHCGHEAYVLVHTDQGWRIINFADSDTPLRGRDIQTVCPLP